MSSRSDDLNTKKGKQMHLKFVEKQLRGVIGNGSNPALKKQQAKASIGLKENPKTSEGKGLAQKTFGSALKNQRKTKNMGSNIGEKKSIVNPIKKLRSLSPSFDQLQNGPLSTQCSPSNPQFLSLETVLKTKTAKTKRTIDSVVQNANNSELTNKTKNPKEALQGTTPDTSINSGTSGRYYSNMSLLNKVTSKSKMPQLSSNHRDVQPPPTNPVQYSGIIGGKKDLDLLIAPNVPSFQKKGTNQPNSYSNNFTSNASKTRPVVDKQTSENKSKAIEQKKKPATGLKRATATTGIERSQTQGSPSRPLGVPQNPKTFLKNDPVKMRARNKSNESLGSNRSDSCSSKNSGKGNRKNIERSLNKFISNIAKEPQTKPIGTKGPFSNPKNDSLLKNEPLLNPRPETEQTASETKQLSSMGYPNGQESNKKSQNSEKDPKPPISNAVSNTSSSASSTGRKQKVNLQLLSEYEMYFGQLIEVPPSKPNEIFMAYQKLARVSFVFDFTEFEAGFKDLKVRNCIKCLFFFEKIGTFIYCAKRKSLANDMVLRAILHYAYKGFILFIELLFSKLPAAHHSNEFLIKIKASIKRRREIFGLPPEPKNGDSFSKFKQINDLLVPLMVEQLLPGTRLQEKMGVFFRDVDKLSFYEGISRLARLLGVFPGEQVPESTIDKYFKCSPSKEKAKTPKEQEEKPQNTTSAASNNDEQNVSSLNSSQNNNSNLSNTIGRLNMNEITESLAESVTIQEENEEDEEDNEEEQDNKKKEMLNSVEKPKESESSEAQLPEEHLLQAEENEEQVLDDSGETSKSKEETSENTEISIPFLPEMSKLGRKFTLVLDLDETLVHFEEVGDMGQFFIRPYAKEFIDELSLYYEVVVFTAAMQDVKTPSLLYSPDHWEETVCRLGLGPTGH